METIKCHLVLMNTIRLATFGRIGRNIIASLVAGALVALLVELPISQLDFSGFQMAWSYILPGLIFGVAIAAANPRRMLTISFSGFRAALIGAAANVLAVSFAFLVADRTGQSAIAAIAGGMVGMTFFMLAMKTLLRYRKVARTILITALAGGLGGFAFYAINQLYSNNFTDAFAYLTLFALLGYALGVAIDLDRPKKSRSYYRY